MSNNIVLDYNINKFRNCLLSIIYSPIEILIIFLFLGMQNIVKKLSIIIIINLDTMSVKIDLLLDSNLIYSRFNIILHSLF